MLNYHCLINIKNGQRWRFLCISENSENLFTFHTNINQHILGGLKKINQRANYQENPKLGYLLYYLVIMYQAKGAHKEINIY